MKPIFSLELLQANTNDDIEAYKISFNYYG